MNSSLACSDRNTQGQYYRKQKRSNNQYTYGNNRDYQQNYNLKNHQGVPAGNKKPVKNYATGSPNTTSSDSEGTYSELYGFKIIHEGLVLLDETDEESCYSDSSENRFASSKLTVGPNPNSISIPSFLE